MKKILHKRIFSFMLLLFLIISWLFCAGGTAPARADAAKYSGVMADLQKDENFNKSAYVVDDTNYSLQLIQIAESADGELFVYTFNPSYVSKSLTATTIRLSTAINENYSPKDYVLTKTSEDNGFSKYVVKDFTVKADALRYYNIVCLHRTYDKSIDGESGTDNVISEVPIEVAQLWTASTVNGVVSYNYIYEDVITITDRWDGFVEYENGFHLFYNCCRSHFIAFNTDRQIDKLVEADVSFYYIDDCIDVDDKITNKGDPIYVQSKTLTCNEKGENQADGWFATKYTWDRIETAEAFLSDTDVTLSEEAKTNISSKAWVLRFFETEVSQVSSGTEYTSTSELYYTEVSEVTVLRLKFETDGVSYNLGVVDDKRNSDDKFDGTGNEQNFGELILAWVIFVLAIVVGLWCLKFVSQTLVTILSGSMNVVFKIIFSLLTLALLIVYGIVLISWAIPMIVNLGCLGIAEIDKVLTKIAGW